MMATAMALGLVVITMVMMTMTGMMTAMANPHFGPLMGML
jgi:hypothetical protein